LLLPGEVTTSLDLIWNKLSKSCIRI